MVDEFIFDYAKKVRDAVKKEGAYYLEYSLSVPDPQKQIKIEPDVLAFNKGPVKLLGEKYGINCDSLHAGGCNPRYCIQNIRQNFADANKQIALMGNIDHSLMMQGTPETIEKEVKYCIDTLGQNKSGFILSTGGEIPFNTPLENAKTLARVLKREKAF
jgi:uroporphyrinogen decarboxylase